MNKYLKLLFIFISIIFLLVYVFFVVLLYNANLVTPGYSYGVSLSTDKTLTNVTLIIPMPTEEGKILDISKISTQSTNWEEYHDWYNPSGWKGWNVTIIDTRYGIMMKFTKDKVFPDTQAYKFRTNNILYMTKTVNYPINGYDPFRNDVLIRPRENHENPAVYQEKLQHEYDIPFSTYAYISYDNYSEINASIFLSIDLVVNTGMIKHESRYRQRWYSGMYSEYSGGNLNSGWNTLNGTTRVFVGQFKSVPSWLEILFPLKQTIDMLGQY